MSAQQIIGYVRVSTQEQADSGLSIAAQNLRLAQFAEFKGLKLVDVVHDENVSASIPLADRPGGAQLLARTRDGALGVAAVKLDRLFRDALDCLATIKVWNAQGVGLHLLDLGVDTTTAQGKAFLTNAAAYAELERNLIAERTREALKQVRAQGGVLGGDGFGWRRADATDASGRRVIELVPEEFSTLVECRTLRDMGWTLQRIADKFNGEGRRTKRGGKWYPSTVKNCCTNDLPQCADGPRGQK
jgi:DNA invertase Pin-like site-specific DNA recombinase